MSRQLKWALVLLVGAVALAAVMIALRPEPEELAPVETTPLVETAAYEVTSGAIAILASGTVQPREEVTLGVEISGKLTHVNPAFREGHRLARGALLVRIDPADYTNRVRSARADVAAQDVALLQAQQEATIAEAELQQFAERQNTRSVLSRAIESGDYAARILPPESLSGATPSTVQSTVPATTAPNRLATREPQLRSAEAARERAAAQLADAQLALSRTRVHAPFGGIVRSESAAVGTLVQPGQSLGTIVATDFFEVRVSLTEGEAGLLPALFAAGRTNIPAQVMLDFGELSYSWPAQVDRVDPILDPETRTINVFLRVPNPMRAGTPVLAEGEEPSGTAAPPLLLGSFVRVSITGTSSQPYAIIPLAALRSGNEVWVLRQGRLRIVPVTVIQRADNLAYVAAAELGAGGQVIVSTLRSPVDGMELRSQAADAAESAPGE